MGLAKLVRNADMTRFSVGCLIINSIVAVPLIIAALGLASALEQNKNDEYTHTGGIGMIYKGALTYLSKDDNDNITIPKLTLRITSNGNTQMHELDDYLPFPCSIDQSNFTNEINISEVYFETPLWLSKNTILAIISDRATDTSKICELTSDYHSIDYVKCTTEMPITNDIEISGLFVAVQGAYYTKLNPNYNSNNGQPTTITGSDIYVINLIDFSVTQITSKGENINPKFSSDNKKIAYVSNQAGKWDIYVQETLSLGNPVRVTAEEFSVIGPLAWSPDGRYIALAGGIGNGWTFYILDNNLNIIHPLPQDVLDISQEHEVRYVREVRQMQWTDEIMALASIDPQTYSEYRRYHEMSLVFQIPFPDNPDLFNILKDKTLQVVKGDDVYPHFYFVSQH